MKEWMKSEAHHPVGSFVEDVAIKDYQDTKILLHFSHFKILDRERDTCFPDAPHQCDDVEAKYKESLLPYYL